MTQTIKPAVALTFLLLVSPLVHAQNVPNTTTLRGVISSVPENRRVFVLLDRSGAQVTVSLNPATKYILGNDEAKFIDVLVVGDRVNVTLNPSGYAIDVTNRNRSGRPTSEQLQEDLGLTNEECDVLVPLIIKVQSLKQSAQTNGPTGSPIRTILNTLRTAVQNPNVSSTDLTVSLQALRTARAKAQSDYEKATQDLIPLLTLRQEALLVQMDILD